MKQNAKFKVYEIALIFIIAGCISTRNQVEISTASPKPSNTPTIALINTPISINTPEATTVVFRESTSPDDIWIAKVFLTTQGINKNLLFKVINKLNNQTWVIEDVDFTEPQNPLEGFQYPYIFKWSKYGDFLYYSHLSTGGDGCYVLSEPGGFDLKKVNLSTGEVIAIRDSGGTWMVLSPDEKKLAYINGWNGGVTILEIENGEESVFPLPPIKNEQNMITATSYLYWAPNGKTLIYSHMVGVCDIKIWYGYIIQINPENGKQTTLVDHDDRGLIPVEWELQDKILLIDNENKSWWLNSITKEITPIH